MDRFFLKNLPTALVCVFCVVFTQSAFSQYKIDISQSQRSIEQLLELVSEQSGYQFAYNADLFLNEPDTDFSIKASSITQVLEELKGRVYIDYEIIDEQVILKSLPKSKLPVYTFSGYISDSLSGESLIGSTISIENSYRGTTTNGFGYFALPVHRGFYSFSISYVGYEEQKVSFFMDDNISLNLNLKPVILDLATIEITPETAADAEDNFDRLDLKPEDLTQLPELGGESGLVKNLDQINGVKQHSDLSSFFFVRGGERDQNIIYIDDAPIYNPSHMLGLSSLVLPDYVSQISVYKSDMPSNLGDRVSSVIDVRTRDGNLNQFSMSGALSPFVNRLTFEIPVIKQKSSIFTTYRRSAYELLYRNITEDADFHFTDFQIKWNYRMNDNNRFYVTALTSFDEFTAATRDVSRITWGNFAATLRWNHVFSPKLFSNTTLYTGNYGYTVNFPPSLWKSELGSVSIKSDFTHYWSPDFTANFGLEGQAFFTTPGQLTVDSTNSILPNISSNYGRKTVFYYHGKYRLSKDLVIDGGLRFIYWENIGPDTYFRFDENYESIDKIEEPEGPYHSYFNLDPRISLFYKLDKTSSVRLHYGLYHQYVQLISNSISPFTAMEIWLTASPNIRPQYAHHWTMGYRRISNDGKSDFTASAYYKIAENQIELNGHAIVYLNEQLEGELRFGRAKSYGIELDFNHSFNKFEASFNYTWARTFKQFNDLNNSHRFPAFQDRPHAIGLTAIYSPSNRLRVSGYWTSSSGSPFTSPIGFYTFNEKTTPIYGERNNDRLPAYHRLDVSVNYYLNKDMTKTFLHSITFSIFNVLAHKNVYNIKFNKYFDDEYYPDIPVNTISNTPLHPSQAELLQFLPSLTYRFAFR